MKALVAGASGTIGMPLVRLLRRAGHDVVAVYRAPGGHAKLTETGAIPVQADVLNQRSLSQALEGQQADAVIAQLTALKKTPIAHKDMVATNQLRADSTANLLTAPYQLRARRFVIQSTVFGYGFGDWADRVLTEADPFAPPPGHGRFEAHLAALRSAEAQVLGADHLDGIALRYGQFYGPGPASDALVAGLRRRRLPVTRASGPVPLIYIDDAVSATVAALDLGEHGTAYNIADAEPVSMSALLTAISEAVGAPRPWTVPGWLLTATPFAKAIVTGGLRVSSDKAKTNPGWAPRAPAHRDGLRLFANYYLSSGLLGAGHRGTYPEPGPRRKNRIVRSHGGTMTSHDTSSREDNAGRSVAADLGSAGWLEFGEAPGRRQVLSGGAEFIPWMLEAASVGTARRVLDMLPAPSQIPCRGCGGDAMRVPRDRYRPAADRGHQDTRMKLTLFGATGATRTCILRQVLAAGDTVTVVARDPARLATPLGPHLRVATADGMDPARTVAALPGADAIISAIGPPASGRSTVTQDSTASVFQAMQQTGARRLHTVNGSIVTDDGEGPFMRYLLKPLLRSTRLRYICADMRHAEDEIRHSRLDWTNRQEELRRRAGEERMRIARDLHDVVAHNISVINVQANTALHLMDRQPDRARTALTTINEVSRQALAELRSVLGVLRDVDESEPRAPAPGLARLDDLADTAAAAGLAVRIEERGQRAPLPADVDLAAYRIVQEALTNSVRHSGGTNATIRIAYRKDALGIEVDDDGARRPPGRPAGQAQGTGSGIAGMTERAAALGGTLQAGPWPGGGFAVRAWLPLPGGDR
jgi:signal transduction histidine kinase/nucleoside-diphosphate-sugar epimerase